MMFRSNTSKQRDRSGQFIVEVKKPKKRFVRPADTPSRSVHLRQDRKTAEEKVKGASVFRSWAIPEEME